MDFGQLLNRYLDVLSLNGKELSERSGVSQASISRYRRGEIEPGADSSAVDAIISALAQAASDRGVDLSAEEIRGQIYVCLSAEAKYYDGYLQRLRALLQALNIRNAEFARGVSYDPSFISRILSGTNSPADLDKFTQRTASFIQLYCLANLVDPAVLCELFEADEKTLTEPDGIYYKTIGYLGYPSMPHGEGSDPVHRFLDKMESFNLNDYIRAIRFDDIKLPTVPFQLPTAKTYSTLDGMKKCELDFIKATVISKSMSDCILYSNMPMEEMAKDEDFAKKWMFGMAMMLKKGLHLNIIHDVYRPFHEMMLGLESNIPMYMTGQISPWYLPGQQSSPLNYLLKVSGSAAMEGVAISGHHADCRYTLSKNDEDIRYYRKKAEHLLEKARPLMDIYRSDRKDAFAKAIAESWQGGDRLIVSSALPLFTLSGEALKAILDRHHISEKDADGIEAYRVELLHTVTDFLKNNKLTVAVPDLSRKQYETAPIHMALSELFYEIEIAYTYDEYAAHLAATEQFAEEHPNLTLMPDRSPAFRNITYSVIQNRMVIVTKNKYPTIHFVIHHKKMIRAFQTFTPPVKDA